MKTFISATLFSVLAFVALSNAAPVASTTTAPAVSPTYSNTVLRHHNVHRSNHSATAVQWGTHMYDWAFQLASRCEFAHNTSIGWKPYGQNIAAGTSPADISAVVTDEFYNGEVNWYAGQYGKANPDFTNFGHWGHFSQVVWNSTTNVGCATVDCSKTGIKGLEGYNIAPWMTVCNYFPAGNMGGGYGANIGKPLNRPTVYENY